MVRLSTVIVLSACAPTPLAPTFGIRPVLSRVEWHRPDFHDRTVHRGVTLDVPR